MNIFLAVISLVAGVIILWKSAELLVTGAVAIAEHFGISSLVVGLTVVAMGTSAPEVAASIAGVLHKTGGGDLAVGNVFGSNIANLALVGGLIALIRPLEVRKQTIRREIPVMIFTALLLWPFLHNAFLSRPEALILLFIFSVLIYLTVYEAKRESVQTRKAINEISEGLTKDEQDTKKNIVYIIIGLAGLALGAKLTVDGAVSIGRLVGLSEAVIALTIIALGTSLPELVTCVVAAVKGHHDISVGNLVGSNVFNTLLVIGAAGIIRPFNIEQRLAGGVDYWIMISISVAFTLAIIIGHRVISRLAGIVLLCIYAGYIIYLYIPS